MNRPRHHSGHAAQNDAITIDSDSSSVVSSHSESEIQHFESRKPKANAAAYTQRLRMRNHTREIRHTAHCILASRELLMLHALASNESIPRTRRRFIAQIIEPDNPKAALDLALDKKPNSGVGAANQGGERAPIGAIQGGAREGNVIDVIEEGDSQGWELGFRRRSSNNPKASSSSPARQSPSTSSWKRGKGKGRTPDPERLAGGRSVSGGEAGLAPSPSPSSRERRERERERRRRWSGAERDRGVRISSAAGEPDPEAIEMDVDMDLGTGRSLNVATATPSRRGNQRTTMAASSDDDEL
ncbi:hypothetical protein PISL3812_06036 [Talaromyces islandicus]|uniref:Uncharacterized protein n=1 Tax=Talaromyces islandicus TaxID=28573 RepID=A0A0U1M1X3_TALIS|nr:hypothetical protein PISL3812_06036 [Talaromyces islandicus]